MKLPESLFNRIVSALHTEEPANPGTRSITGSPTTPEGIVAAQETAGADGCDGNRRSFRRQRVNHPVRYVRHAAPAAVPEPATLLDVSAVGVCILCDRVAAPGEHLLIHLPCGPEAGNARAAGAASPAASMQPVQTIVMRCAVRSCRVRANGMFRVGAEFAEPEGGDGGGADSFRRGERLPSDAGAMMYLYHRDGRQAPLERVGVRDYSEHGVAILRGEPLEVGTELVIRVPRDEDKPLTRLCRVVNVARSDGRYRIGGEFILFPGRGGRSWLGRLWDWIA